MLIQFFQKTFQNTHSSKDLIFVAFSRVFYVSHFLRSRNSAFQPTLMEINDGDVMLFALQLLVHQKITLIIKRDCQKGQSLATPAEPGTFGISAKQVSWLS